MDAELHHLYLDQALERLLAVAAEAGDRRCERPFGESTNSIAALVVHCCEVCEFWLGHVVLGRASTRDRDSEFRREADLTELGAIVSSTRRQAAEDLDVIARDGGVASEMRAFAPRGGTDESIVLYVLRELHQHLGHAELTLDVFRDRPPERPST